MAKAIEVLVSVDVRQFGRTSVILPDPLPVGLAPETYAENVAQERLYQDNDSIQWDSLTDAELIDGSEVIYPADDGMFETDEEGE